MTVEDLLARISSRELAEWAVFESEYGPLGPARGDWQAALVAHTVASVMTDSKERPKLSSFLLNWSGARKRQSGVDQLKIFEALASIGSGVASVNDSQASDSAGG